MTRYEAIKKMSKPEMEAFLCDLWLLSASSEYDSCAICPMSHYCYEGHKGWFDFLSEEWDDRYTAGATYDSFQNGGHYGK